MHDDRAMAMVHEVALPGHDDRSHRSGGESRHRFSIAIAHRIVSFLPFNPSFSVILSNAKIIMDMV